ncbi:hypothetical protein EV383_5582 [Pseudonocardia sediminis]|uniref:Acyl dehydratase n=1 Tax=Pseudonocardia sediminis TaxID=1397368 RepID=A0A4Q7V4N3_PSEST|nr:hypothetical protein [Pseudonocardia sediminis]RZT88638.1 hypothetical protein EV383_5582 [Pseudonocardia sediminis]
MTAGPGAAVVLEPDEVPARAGSRLGLSGWLEVSASRVRDYRRATADTSAPDAVPGLLLLSLLSPLVAQVLEVGNTRNAVNHTVGPVRFPAPLAVGGRVRAAVDLYSARWRPRGFLEVVVEVAMLDTDGHEVCTARQGTLYATGTDDARDLTPR